MSVTGCRENARRGTGDDLMCYETIILCQPDTVKSCSACCGLFNFKDISRETLSRFLEEGAARSSACIAAGDFPDQGDHSVIRDLTSYICPHQGLIFNKRPGCLLHPDYRTTTLRNQSFFGEKICNGFLCPAHEILSPEQKRLIIDFCDDWYAYSIAIIDPFFTARLLDCISEKCTTAPNRTDIMKKILHDCLMMHAGTLEERSGPIFFYSLSEYSAATKSERRDECGISAGEMTDIEDVIRLFL
jgi:hypothetical protein